MSATEETKYISYEMTERQLASTVRQGMKITFIILDETPVDGYLAGWDSKTYFVLNVEPNEDGVNVVYKNLIPKNNILRMILSDKRTFREEALYPEMDAIVKRWRDWINNNYFPDARTGSK